MSKISARLRASWYVATGTGSAATFSLGMLVLACVFISVAGPRVSQHSLTSALQNDIASTPAQARSVYGTIGYGEFDVGEQGAVPATDIRLARDALLTQVSASLPVQAGQDWSGESAAYVAVQHAPPQVTNGGVAPQVEVLYRDALPRFSRLVSGSLPTAVKISGHKSVFQVAVTTATAHRFALAVGSRIQLGANVMLQVTGIIAARQPGSTFWTIDPVATAPLLNQIGRGEPYWQGAAFIGAQEVLQLPSVLNNQAIQLEWDFPLSLKQVSAAQARPLLGRLNGLISQGGQVSYGSAHGPFIVNIPLASGTAETLAQFVQQESAVSTVLSLLFSSLAVIGAVILLLASRLLAEHRSGEFAMMRARGAGRPRIVLHALGGGAIVALPAAAAGAAIAIAVTPGPSPGLSWLLAGLALFAALAGPPAFAVSGRRAGFSSRLPGSERPDRTITRREARRRLVIEVALVVAAVGGVIVLRRQGTQTAGFDPFTSAAPVLVAVPAAVITLRCYPLLLRPLLRFAGHRPGVTAFVGLARAARTSVTTLLPAFAMVLALAVVAFGAMLRGAVREGETAASWQQTGADAVVNSGNAALPLSVSVQRQIAAVPGVVRTATVLVTSGTTSQGGLLTLAFVGPAQFAAVVAQTPEPRFPSAALASAQKGHTGGSGSAALPAVGTPSALGMLGHRPQTLFMSSIEAPLKVRITGVVSSVPAISNVSAGPLLILPVSAEGASGQPPNLMLITGPSVDGGRLTGLVQRTLPGSSVVIRSRLLAALIAAPLSRGGYLAFAACSLVATGFLLLILLITLLLGARSRELTLARMGAMGLLPAQGRLILVVEALPQILAATIGGIGCALALAPTVGPALELSVFTGGGGAIRVQAEPLVLAAVAGGLVLLAMMTLAVQAAIMSREGSARALRIGE
jgi:putative ABC transport system permease protein